MRPHSTVQIIRTEHSTLSAVLRSIGLLLTESRRHGIEPDFKVLRAMLFYIDEFPEKVHHTKESALLFPILRERSAKLAAVLDRLDRDHEASHRAVLDLQHDVLALEMMSEAPNAKSRQADFEERMHAYIASYLDHMRVEETEVLPLAESVLTEADWTALDEAFMQNRDPLTHRQGDDSFRPLFKRILMTLPAPLGLGSAMEAIAGLAPAELAAAATDRPLQARPQSAAPRPCQSANPEEAASSAPAQRTDRAAKRRPSSALRRPDQRPCASQRPSVDASAKLAITAAPGIAPEASAATSRADCSRPQGIAVQHAPTRPARAGAGSERKIRTGWLPARRASRGDGTESHPGARPVRSSQRPRTIAATCTMPQSGRSIGAAGAKLASVDTLVAASAPPAAYPTMRPACSASIRCDKGPP